MEPYEFSDIDRTVAAGLSLTGQRWGRPNDTFGLAGIVNGISSVHEAYLNAGGLGILVGDGQLPHPGSEQIIEALYSFPVGSWLATLDYQFIANPGYNRDRARSRSLERGFTRSFERQSPCTAEGNLTRNYDAIGPQLRGLCHQ
jgi:Carbohydrate-selective porin, OprB family